MPDVSTISQVLDGVKSLSPLVALMVLIGALAYRWFQYREHKEDKDAKSVEAQEEVEHMMLTRKTSKDVVDVKDHLADHSLRAAERADAQMDVFQEVLRQLIQLNSAQAGSAMSSVNAKLIIEYQWAWCRSETIRVVCNSIRNNHFKRQEGEVARRVYRAWVKAAKESALSVSKFKGVTYPYQLLFSRHITFVWDTTWKWAVAVYHSNIPRDSAEFDAKLQDLSEQIETLFNQVLLSHVSIAEDVDIGLIYAPEPDSEHRPANVPEDLSFAAEMGKKLETFTVDSVESSSRFMRFTPANIRGVVFKNIDESRAEAAANKPVYHRPRSDSNIKVSLEP